MRPLEGLFVLDFSTLLPGPLATLLLAEAGAEVVKIEPPATTPDATGKVNSSASFGFRLSSRSATSLTESESRG